MLFCENCRVKKNWPMLPGYPYIGYEENQVCEVCRTRGNCHDVPASRLKPDKDKTYDEKLLDKNMEIAYRKKAEALEVWKPGGKFDSVLTQELQAVFVPSEAAPDWYCTYQLRLKIQRGHRLSEEQKRDRRNYVL